MNTYTTHSNHSLFDVCAGQTFTVYDYEARNRLRRYRQNRALPYLCPIRALIHCLSRLTLSCRFFFLYFILYSFSPLSSNWIGHWWPGQYWCRKELYIYCIYKVYLCVCIQNYCINSERIRRKKKNKSKNKHQKEMEGSIQFSRYSVLSMRIYSQKGRKNSWAILPYNTKSKEKLYMAFHPINS